MPNRLRVYFVLDRSRDLDWLSWISLRSYNSSYRIDTEGAIGLIHELLRVRKGRLTTLMRRLDDQRYRDSSLSAHHPFFIQLRNSDVNRFVHSVVYPMGLNSQQDLPGLEFELNSFFGSGCSTLDGLSVTQLLQFAEFLREGNMVYEERSTQICSLG